MADMFKRVPVREQEAKVRATNFDEVCYGYNKEEAMEETMKMPSRTVAAWSVESPRCLPWQWGACGLQTRPRRRKSL